MTRLRAVLALSACLGASACSGAPGEPEGPGLSASVPGDAASIIGPIKEVQRMDGRLRILVEQIPTRSAGEPIAWITVDRGTQVLARGGDSTSRASADELAVGTRVSVWFTGPVMESFPVQATAGTILIHR